ncbi:Hsp33 family molecular chaperone HslO [Motiliproteus sp. MSK22-1]|uniref:Hsp33 family molecular chaperone HslO n=1 Tax=Motiliproteus sp. MSK22-1 TaxID=1897630 RepID=UPI0009759FCB|nr:Hsp33 family molecular chaperone HslO [Motiliproteus sp. MSK22-1]OMH38963.1 Hsp33 family molecular chaperone [Motiliproteus sp. MSK22-1]
MSNSDQIQRFLFEDTDQRGVLVGLESCYQEVLSRHPYPVKVASLLGEMLAAIGLLSSTLKFEGRLSLLARGDGPVSMLMAECNHRRDLRAIARWQDPIADDAGLPTLLGNGQLAITIEPDRGNRYQGIVPLEKPQLAQCLEEYFMQSEQLATRITLAADTEKAAGLLLQALPSDKDSQIVEENWDRITHLGSTLTSQELLTLDNSELLHRLYHQEDVRVFDAEELRFDCDCSRERSLTALKTLQSDELEEMLEKEGSITMDCQFCNNQYRFDRTSIAEIQGVSGAVEPSKSCH